MKTNRELLELAAKAAGVEYDKETTQEDYRFGLWLTLHGEPTEFTRRSWNPLTDDGDALRLAVNLTLEVDICKTGIAVRTPTGIKVLIDSDEELEAYAATRRAIVRAAAAIGEVMK